MNFWHGRQIIFSEVATQSYDFNWYIAQGVSPNLLLLQNALFQYGPWQDQSLVIDHDWLVKALAEKISTINWQDAVPDVGRFLKPVEQKSLQLWSERFYMNKLGKLDGLLRKNDGQ